MHPGPARFCPSGMLPAPARFSPSGMHPGPARFCSSGMLPAPARISSFAPPINPQAIQPSVPPSLLARAPGRADRRAVVRRKRASAHCGGLPAGLPARLLLHALHAEAAAPRLAAYHALRRARGRLANGLATNNGRLQASVHNAAQKGWGYSATGAFHAECFGIDAARRAAAKRTLGDSCLAACRAVAPLAAGCGLPRASCRTAPFAAAAAARPQPVTRLDRLAGGADAGTAGAHCQGSNSMRQCQAVHSKQRCFSSPHKM
eukprot:366576-Chlamydomonas_euryale.AAC.13